MEEKIQEAKKHLKEWGVLYAVVGFVWNEQSGTTDFSASIVCNEKQRLSNEKKFIDFRIFELKEISNDTKID